MMNIAGLGRLAAATIVLSGLAFGSAARAQEVSEEQLKAARAAMDAIGATTQYDNILPGLAERLTCKGEGRRERGDGGHDLSHCFLRFYWYNLITTCRQMLHKPGPGRPFQSAKRRKRA